MRRRQKPATAAAPPARADAGAVAVNVLISGQPDYGNYPAGVIPYLGASFLGSQWPGSQSHTTARAMIAIAASNDTVYGSARKLAYNTGIQAMGSGGGTKGVSSPNPGLTIARANGAMLHSSATSAQSAEMPFGGGGGSGTLTDPSNPTWQATVLDWCRTYFTLHPTFTAMYFDNFQDTITAFGYPYPIYDQNGALLWSTAAEFQDAQLSFAQNVIRELKRDGFAVGVNGGTSLNHTGQGEQDWMVRYIGYMTMVQMEYWIIRINGASYLQDGNLSFSWNDFTDMHAWLHSNGLGFFPRVVIDTAVSPTTRDRQIRYALASYLMNWNGIPATAQIAESGACLFSLDSNPNAIDIWDADMAKDLGIPTSPKQGLGANGLPTPDSHNAQVWLRDCTHGYALINPTISAQTVGVHGQTYSIPSGDAVLVVT